MRNGSAEDDALLVRRAYRRAATADDVQALLPFFNAGRKERDFDLGIQRALERNDKKGRVVAGGSTISQQLAKNLFLWPGRSLVRKGIEAYLAAALELHGLVALGAIVGGEYLYYSNN